MKSNNSEVVRIRRAPAPVRERVLLLIDSSRRAAKRMSDPVYLPARELAPSVHERLSRLHEEARREGRTGLAAVPGVHVIERLIEAGFWASLRREEGHSPKISIAVVADGGATGALTFAQPLSLSPRTLGRLSPAVERPGIHLCVESKGDDLRLWGALRLLPEYSLVVETVEPGLVVAKYSRSGAQEKYGNLAVFRGDRVKLINEDAARRPDCPALLANLTGAGGSTLAPSRGNVLVRLALSMRAHRHGGTLLIVPPDDTWQRSIVSPIRYRLAPPFTRLAQLSARDPDQSDSKSWIDDLRDAIDGVAGLTAVDGATIMNMRYELLAFGAKIERPPDSATVKNVMLMEPVVGNVPREVEASSIGGTRHLSAAQFVQDQRDALALVASQDEHFTIFSWSNIDNIVHAQRIEALLL